LNLNSFHYPAFWLIIGKDNKFYLYCVIYVAIYNNEKPMNPNKVKLNPRKVFWKCGTCS